MAKYILQRIGLMVITLFLVLTITFFLIHSVPGGPFSNPAIRPEVRLVLERRYLLDQPKIVQFGHYLSGILHLDFGISMIVQPQADVYDILTEKFPLTIILNMASNIFTLPVAFFFGIMAALKKNTVFDHGISIMIVLFISVPSFVLASLLQYTLAYKLGWFPLIFSTSQSFDAEKIHSMILPILALSFGGIAYITRYLRAELTEALNSDYMLLAATKGLSTRQAVLRHAIRNSLIPIIGMIIGIFFGVLSGSIVVENVFSIPGIGRLTISAINSQDYPLIMAGIIMYAAIGLVLRLVVDLSYGFIDPRIVVGGGKNAARE